MKRKKVSNQLNAMTCFSAKEWQVKAVRVSHYAILKHTKRCGRE